MKLAVFEILDKVSKLKTDQEKIFTLQNNTCPALLTVLQGAFDDRIKWALPEGAPPYKPNEAPDTHNVLHAETRKMYLFIEGGNPGLKQLRREALFIELLESVHPGDAKIILAIKDKKSPVKGITKNIVQQAFPGLCM
jgi:hypothetical protein